MTALTLRDLSVVSGEPRVHDLKLAGALGFQRLRDVRQLIDRNSKELRSYGELARRDAAKNEAPRGTAENGFSPQAVANRGRGRPKGSTGGFMLNEGQALLVCMFSQTDRAAEVRRQLITVFMAYRAGELQAAPRPARRQRLDAPLSPSDPRHPDFRDPLLVIDGRRALLEKFHAFDGKRADDRMIRMITHLLTPAGPGGCIKWPKWYHDKDVLTAVVQTHRQAELQRVVDLLKANFGWRAPSKSSLHRFWLRLDGLFGTGRKLH